MNIIGISAFYHDSACCILQDGEIVAAAQEERFTRKKHDSSMPVKAFFYCLEQSDVTIDQVDCIAFYESPEKKFARQLWCGYDYEDPRFRQKLNPFKVEHQIRELLGWEGDVKYYDHHLSHGASSFFCSGFDEAAILTVDGVGEWATTTYGHGKNGAIEIFEQVDFPDSIGLLYSTITSYLGFRVNNGEYKVMGLAPYGENKYVKDIMKLIKLKNDGQYELNMKYFDFVSGEKMYSPKLMRLFSQPPRKPESEMTQFHKDIAKSLQHVLEMVLLEKCKYIAEKTNALNLCLAGGVALNCVANGKVRNSGLFNDIFIQPAAGDAGGCIGAAALAYNDLNEGNSNGYKALENVYWGPDFTAHKIRNLLGATSLKWHEYTDNPDELLHITAQKLAEGKVFGWFQGRMEFGPRALGARSILADPRVPDMRDRVNRMVKKREGFRPFAPVVMEDKAAQHFSMNHPSPFMLETCQVISNLDLPAITHVDRSARVQTVNEKQNTKIYRLLHEFDKLTDCPILLNTSFNVRGEPIVCTPFDALICFLMTDIDCLTIGDFFVDKSENDIILLKKLIAKYHNAPRSEIVHDVYTFI